MGRDRLMVVRLARLVSGLLDGDDASEDHHRAHAGDQEQESSEERTGIGEMARAMAHSQAKSQDTGERCDEKDGLRIIHICPSFQLLKVREKIMVLFRTEVNLGIIS